MNRSAAENSTAVATVVRNLMLQEGLTQAELAKRAGLSPAGISRILSGEIKSVRFPTLQKLAQALKMTPERLAGIISAQETTQATLTPGSTALAYRYDCCIVHDGSERQWVNTLARNLRIHNTETLSVSHDLGPSRGSVGPIGEGLAHKNILIATPSAVESGWVAEEYERLLAFRQHDPASCVVPIVLGEIPDAPFVDAVPYVDFRDPTPDGYRHAFHKLLCALAGREPKADGTVDGDLDIPLPISGLFLPDLALAPDGSERRFIEQVFATLPSRPILMLLAQAGDVHSALITAIKARAARSYGEGNTLHITPPWSGTAELDQYFARLGRQCGFDHQIRSAADWDDALDERLSRNQQLFLLASGFENGSENARRELAGTLRSLSERHGERLRVVLCGGERLAELKYGHGYLSLLNLAEVLIWPELVEADVLAWQQREFPDRGMDPRDAAAILEVSGRHSSLVRHCLQLPRPPAEKAVEIYQEALRSCHFLWQLFAPFRADTAAHEKICAWLAEDDLGPAEPWPADPFLRRLYWSNLLAVRSRRLRWRSELLRDVGRKILTCAG